MTIDFNPGFIYSKQPLNVGFLLFAICHERLRFHHLTACLNSAMAATAAAVRLNSSIFLHRTSHLSPRRQVHISLSLLTAGQIQE